MASSLHSPSPPPYNSPSPNSGVYRSTPDSRSSVLSRAREYTRRVEDDARRRSKSLDRNNNNNNSNNNIVNLCSPSSQSQSVAYPFNHPNTRQQSPSARSTASGRSYGSSHRGREGNSRLSTNSNGTNNNNNNYYVANNNNSTPTSNSNINNSNGRSYRSNSAGRVSTGSAGGGSISSYRRSLTTRERALASVEKESNNKLNTSYRSSSNSNSNSSNNLKSLQQQQQQQQQSQLRQPSFSSPSSSHQNENSNHSRRMSPARSVRSRARSLSRSRRSSTGEEQPPIAIPEQQQQQQEEEQAGQGEAVVSPELLVDALSGHEDGLLAIAERLMEHYDSGYDAMGEAIIDAFADVQKLFQHVVEAAHMEGAAFESSRREEEIRELKRRVASGEVDNRTANGSDGGGANDNDPSSPSSNGPVRHDEFIDQDVKDRLNDAIRKGISYKEQQQHAQCFELYEQACQDASSLLPVDSDHRGRLQLSIARAESMSPDRGCAILRYAMDDVLRSGLRAGKIPKNYPLSDPSKRADVVLSKPSMAMGTTPQSSEEQLNSLVEELKEIINAPVYEDTPLQDVAKRFWKTLHENQKVRSKNEEKLEHNLGKLKGDYLLARAEWEEKFNEAKEEAESFKRKYNTVKDNKEVSLMEDARSIMSQKFNQSGDSDSRDVESSTLRSSSFRSTTSRPEFKRATESVASMGSNLAAHAKTLVGSFACAGNNERTGQVLSSERATEEWRDRRNVANDHPQEPLTPHNQRHPGLEMSRSASSNRSYREARRVDV